MSLEKFFINVTASVIAGHITGHLLGKTEEEKQKLAKKGRLLGAGLGTLYYLDTVEEHDTVNYSLYSRGRLVYHGICYEDRLDQRLCEHRRAGKVFDHCVYDHAKPRLNALDKEERQIRRNRPKHNYHYNR